MWQEHRFDLQKIQKEIQEKDAWQISSRSTHMTSFFKQRKDSVNWESFKRILSIDLADRSMWVEGGISMQKLAQTTLDFGLIPAVLPEFKGISVAGAIMGAALESASFRHGQFSDQCCAYELILENGQSLVCSESDHSDLFHGVSGSYGTLAKLSAAKIRLKKTKPYVRVEHTLVEDYAKLWPLHEFHDIDYLDAIVLAPNTSLVSKAKAVGIEEIHDGLEGFNRFAASWYIQNIQKSLLSQKTVQYWTLYDYLFRFDLAAFWMGQFSNRSPLRYLFPFQTRSLKKQLIKAFEKHPPSWNPSFFFRLFCNWKLSSQSLYQVLHHLLGKDVEDLFIIQDFYIPSPKLKEFLAFVEGEVQIYPLWLCPVKSSKKAQFLSPHFLQGRAQLPQFTNVGIYGRPAKRKDLPALCQELEQLAHSLGGRKMLYAKNYYSQELFWQIYDQKRYQSLRDKYVPQNRLKDLYSRTCL